MKLKPFFRENYSGFLSKRTKTWIFSSFLLGISSVSLPYHVSASDIPVVFSKQQINVTGKIVDESNNPIDGASIKVKGGTNSTSTDVNGNFTISAPPQGTLVITHVSYEAREININNQGSLNIVLKSSGENLDEVVVIGYGTVRRSENTGSIASVKGKDIAEKPTLSFEGALSGQAAGVNMTANVGNVNQAPVFRIRGTNSLSLSSYPLIVVDGIPMYTEDVSVGGNAS